MGPEEGGEAGAGGPSSVACGNSFPQGKPDRCGGDGKGENGMTGKEYGEIQHFMGFIEGVINAGEVESQERDMIQDALNQMDEIISIVYGRWEKKEE